MCVDVVLEKQAEKDGGTPVFMMCRTAMRTWMTLRTSCPLEDNQVGMSSFLRTGHLSVPIMAIEMVQL